MTRDVYEAMFSRWDNGCIWLAVIVFVGCLGGRLVLFLCALPEVKP